VHNRRGHTRQDMVTAQEVLRATDEDMALPKT
jgi:hypothetical protein